MNKVKDFSVFAIEMVFHLFLFEHCGRGISQKMCSRSYFTPKIKKKLHFVDACFRIINIFCIVAIFFYN